MARMPDPALPDDLRIGDPGFRGRRVRLTFDGDPIDAYEGETIAAALLAAGHRVWRTTGGRGEPRGLFCNMGICWKRRTKAARCDKNPAPICRKF